MNRSELMNGRRLSRLIGFPIYTLDNGKRIANIKDVIFDGPNNKLLAFTVEKRGVFSPHRYILTFDKVKSLGLNAVMVDNDGVFVKEKSAPDLSKALKGNSEILGKRVLTESGVNLGNIVEILINSDTGQAISYEVSSGISKDIGSGRNYIEAPKTVEIGKDAMIVSNEVLRDLQEQAPGGMLGAYQGAVATGAQYGAAITSYTQEQEINLSKGKTAGHDVYDEQGGLIVTKGEIITDRVINDAVTDGKMHDVALAAGVGGVTAGYQAATDASLAQLKGRRVPYDVIDDKGMVVVPQDTVVTDDTIAKAKEYGVTGQLASTVVGETARGGAQSFWTSLSDWASRTWSNLTHATQESSLNYSRSRAVAAQKNFLMGKVAKNDVRDAKGSFALKSGDVITPLVLDTLDRQGLLELVKIKPEPSPVMVSHPRKEEPEVHVVLETSVQHDDHKSHI